MPDDTNVVPFKPKTRTDKVSWEIGVALLALDKSEEQMKSTIKFSSWENAKDSLANRLQQKMIELISQRRLNKDFVNIKNDVELRQARHAFETVLGLKENQGYVALVGRESFWIVAC